MVNALSSPFEYTNWLRNQILITNNLDGTYSFYNLLYQADSSFYINEGYKPRLINFTGKVIQVNADDENLHVFEIYMGEITNDNPVVNIYQS